MHRVRLDTPSSIVLALALLVATGLPRGAAAQEPEPAPGEAETAEDAAGPAATGADEELEALIRVLEDDEARARLIERLRAQTAEMAPEPAAEDLTLADRLAEYTRDLAEGAASGLATLSELAERLTALTDGALALDLDALRDVVLGVAVLVAATFALYLVLQLLFRPLHRRLADGAAGGDLLRRAKRIGASDALDIGAVILAWGAGYGIALGIGTARQVGINQSLFLNAFLIIELIKVASRVLLAPRWGTLRPIRLDDTSAAYWYFWLSRLVSLVGYTFLFVAPALASGVSPDVADAARIVVMLTALVIAVAVVLQNRESVRRRLMSRVTGRRLDPLSQTLAIVARTWHIAVIGYLIAVFGLWLADPADALPFVLAATGKSILAVALGMLVSAFISRLVSGGMRLPQEVRARLPLLEARLNAFVPGVLRVVRVIVAIAVVLTIAQVWGAADIAGWLASEAGRDVVASAVSAALILLAGGIVYLVMQSWVEYRLNPNLGRLVTPRERTLLGLLRNAFTLVLGVIVFMLVLSELGVNIGPLLAGAGVAGLAIGFGAQKLVQDVINGAFIQFENTMNEGDVVTAGGLTGVVERLTVRSVSLRSLDGTYHVLPFSAVDTVSNFMKHFSYHLAAIGVAYRENIAEVKEAMLEAFERLRRTEHGTHILDEFEMQGVVEFASSSIVVRGRIKTLPGQQWAVGRAYNEMVKTVFDERGIEIPFPHVTLYLGEDKQGDAPPLRIRNVDPQQRSRGSEDEREPAPAAGQGEGAAAASGTPAEGGRSRRAPPASSDDEELEDSVPQSRD